MASKVIEIPEIGDVSFSKRRGSRSIRLRVDVNGKIKVTLPHFVPYKTAALFVKKQHEWILTEQAKRVSIMYDEMPIGRAHILRLIEDDTAKKPRTRVTQSEVIVWHNSSATRAEIQAAAKRGAARALKQEAFQYLPKRLMDIAAAEGYEYKGPEIKQLKGRWGSCNHEKHITLNTYLMELPADLIDYVILHELAHTRQLNHGPAFWKEFEAHLPDAKQRRKRMREYQPTIPARRMA